MDNLTKIFKSQAELNRKLVPDLDDQLKTLQGRMNWILKYHLAMQQEQSEMVDSLPWKWWGKGRYDRQNLKVELVDVLFFWVSMVQAAGFDEKDMASAYFQKLKLNHERADKGYATGKYEKVVDGEEDNRRIF